MKFIARYFLALSLLAGYARADLIAFVNESNGRIHGPFPVDSKGRVSLEEGTYRLVPIREGDNPLVVRLKTTFIDDITVTNASLEYVAEYLTKQLLDKAEQPPGFVFDESLCIAEGAIQRGVTVHMSMISCYDFIEYVSECMGLLASYNDSNNIVELRKKSVPIN